MDTLYNLRIIQLNMHHAKSATYNLAQFVVQNKIDILLLQDPYTVNDKIVGFPTHWTIFSTPVELPLACIIVCSDLPIFALTAATNKWCVTVFLDLGPGFYISSLYCTPSTCILDTISTLRMLYSSININHIIIGTDSNARSNTWYDRIENSRGKIFCEFIFEQNLSIINTISGPTFNSAQGESWIDLTLAGNHAQAFIQNWSLVDNDMCSDHNAIYFEITSNKNILYTNCNGYNYKKADWNLFLNNLNELLETVDPSFPLDKDSVENRSLQIQNILTSARQDYP